MSSTNRNRKASTKAPEQTEFYRGFNVRESAIIAGRWAIQEYFGLETEISGGEF